MAHRLRKNRRPNRYGPYWSGPVRSMSPRLRQTTKKARASGASGRRATIAAPPNTIRSPTPSIGVNSSRKSHFSNGRRGDARRKMVVPLRSV